MTEVLLIDAQSQRSETLAAALREQGMAVATSKDLPALDTLPPYACLICQYEQINQDLSHYAAALPVIVYTENASIPSAVSCIRRGAADYLAWPVSNEMLVAAVERASAQTALAQKQSLEHFPMIGSSEAMRRLKESIAKVAPTDSTVLILGQSGTGKELVARALHAASKRSVAPLISINCATVPQNLIEAELFGLEPFEAPATGHRGLIEAAEGGTLFLDEIGELPSAAQARLLKVLHGENRRVGSSATAPADVRIIAATHRDLAQLVESGQFREDLYYRLNVVCLELLPLKQRAADVAEIADWLLERTSTRLNKEGLKFSTEARVAMQRYHWPGNVRELENAIERAVILADDHSEITQALLAIQPEAESAREPEIVIDNDQTSLEDYFVRFVLENQDQFTETELADKLGISRKSLWERRQRLNIPRRKTRKRGPRRDAS